MSIRQTIKKVLREQFQIKDELIRLRDEVGLEDAIKYVGDVHRYIKLVYNNDIKEFFRTEGIEPYIIKGEPPSMHIHPLVVETLNLPDFGKDEKELGDFRYNPQDKNNLRFSLHTRLRKYTLINGEEKWKVVGMGGSVGFGYAFINKRDMLGKRSRLQIYTQIINKYKLDSFR